MARTLNEHLLNDSHNFISLSGVEFAIQRHLQLIFQELSKLPLFHFASAHDTANFQNHETMKFSRVLIKIKFFFFFFFKISIKFLYNLMYIEVFIIKLIENYILFLFVLKKIYSSIV